MKSKLDPAPPGGYPSALFRYAITPSVVSVSESASKRSRVTWMIAVKNDTGQSQKCTQIVFRVPYQDKEALVIDPQSIDCSPATGTEWSIQKGETGEFIAIPNPGNDGLWPGEAVAFFLSNATIDELPGLGQIAVLEDTGEMRETKLDVIKKEPGLTITSFTANPIQVDPGQSTRLQWTSTGATSAVLNWGRAPEEVSVDDSMTLDLVDNTAVTLTITGAGGSFSQTINLSVLRAKILSFTVEPNKIQQFGPATLRWKMHNAAKAFIDPGNIEISGDKIEDGSMEVRPASPTMYVLNSRGAGTQNDDSRSVYLNVENVEINNFSATPAKIQLRQSAVLKWETSWAPRVRILPDIGEVASSGELTVSPQCNTEYTLVAEGLSGPISKVIGVEVQQTSLLPVGTILPFAGNLPADLELLGWMLCDGRTLAARDYRCLHYYIKNSYGTPGDGFFNIPDLRGVFLRGVDQGGGRDPNVGSRWPSKEGGAAGDHVGSFQQYATAAPKNPFLVNYGNLDLSYQTNDSGCQARPAAWTDDVQHVEAASGGDKESRPVNKYVYFIIKTKLVTEANTYVVPPVASIMSFGTPVRPDANKWLHCNGAEISRESYQALAAAIGTIHGDSGGNVKLPDYRDYFLRGVDGGTNRDPDAGERGPPNPNGPDGSKGNGGANIGSRQYWATGLAHNALKTPFANLPHDDAGEQVDGSMRSLARVNWGSTTVDLTGFSGGDDETRPRNMSVDWYIRAG